jgi:hypothetical protein
MTGDKNFSLHKRTKKNKTVFYCQLKNPDGTWSTAKSTGIIVNSKNEKQAYKQAVTWAINYLQNGNIIYQENAPSERICKRLLFILRGVGA